MNYPNWNKFISLFSLFPHKVTKSQFKYVQTKI